MGLRRLRRRGVLGLHRARDARRRTTALSPPLGSRCSAPGSPSIRRSPGRFAGCAGAAFAPVRAAALFARLAGSEWLRGVFFTGFVARHRLRADPPSPLAGLPPVVGVYGVGGLSAFVAALCAIALQGGGQRTLLGGARHWRWSRPSSPASALFGHA